MTPDSEGSSNIDIEILDCNAEEKKWLARL